MNIRVALIIIALLAPVAVLSVLAQQAGHEPEAKPPEQVNNKPPSGPKSTPAQASADADAWKQPANVQEARERARRRLAQLEKMTEEQWQAEQRQKQEAAQKVLQQHQNQKPPAKQAKRGKWDKMTPEQKIDTVLRKQQKIDGGRAAEITPIPASPPGDLAPAANR